LPTDHSFTCEMATLEDLKDFFREKEPWTHQRLSAYLQHVYRGEWGFSVHSRRDFVALKTSIRHLGWVSRRLTLQCLTALPRVVSMMSCWLRI